MKKKSLFVFIACLSAFAFGCIPKGNSLNVDIEPIEAGEIDKAKEEIPEDNTDNGSSDDVSGEVEELKPDWVLLNSSYYYDGVLRTQMEYNEQGQILNCYQYDLGELLEWIEYNYDSEGKNTGYTGYYSDGTISCIETEVYDKFDNLIYSDFAYYNEDGSQQSGHAVIYNADANTLFVESYANDQFSGSNENIYDDKGNLLDEKYYDTDGTVTSETKYTYYEDGTLKSLRQYGYEDIYMDYDEYGHMTYEEYFDSEGNTTMYCDYQNTYNSDGTISIHVENYGYDNEYLGSEEITLNEDGLNLEYIAYDVDGNIETREVYTYDDEGNMLTNETFDGDGIKTSWTEFIEDKDSGTKKYTTYNYDGSTSERILYFNDGKNYLEENYYNGTMTYHTDIEYDENGNRIKVTQYDRDGNMVYCEEEEYRFIG